MFGRQVKDILSYRGDIEDLNSCCQIPMGLFLSKIDQECFIIRCVTNRVTGNNVSGKRSSVIFIDNHFWEAGQSQDMN